MSLKPKRTSSKTSNFRLPANVQDSVIAEYRPSGHGSLPRDVLLGIFAARCEHGFSITRKDKQRDLRTAQEFFQGLSGKQDVFSFADGDIIEHGEFKIGLCLPNAIRAHLRDPSMKIYKGYAFYKTHQRIADGQFSYGCISHFFNVKDGKVHEFTQGNQGSSYYVGKEITLDEATAEKHSGEWKIR